MIKISFGICGTCLIVWIIFVAIISSSVNNWGNISIVTACIAIGSFVLSYLGGHIIKGNRGAIRLGVLISVSWIVGFFVAFEPYNKNRHWTEFIVFGIIPIIAYFGILWVVSSFLPKKKKMENS